MRPALRTRAAAALVAMALTAAACSSDEAPSTDGDTTTTSDAPSGSASTGGAGGAVVFNGQGNNLVAYDTEPPFTSQQVITNATDDPEGGRDINAQICFWDDPERGRMFISGEDTGQPDPPAGWGIFELDGEAVGDFEATQVGKLTPTYQESVDGAENYGCGMLSSGAIVTSDVGDQAVGPGTGQLILWFPPFDRTEVPYCKIDVGIGTAQSIWVSPDDEVYLASSRGAGTDDRPGGVYRYSGDWPTGPTAEEGCDGTDATGAPLTTTIERELVIPTGEHGMLFPSGLAPTPEGGLYVSSVASGVIAEYDLDGTFVRTILEPEPGDALDADSFATGTPLGIGVGPDGTLYFADIGVVSTVEDGSPYIGPGELTGSVRRIVIADGEPSAPETMADGLAFPDGIGIWLPAG